MFGQPQKVKAIIPSVNTEGKDRIARAAAKVKFVGTTREDRIVFFVVEVRFVCTKDKIKMPFLWRKSDL